MESQLYLDLLGEPKRFRPVRFQESDEANVAVRALQEQGIAVFEVDAAKIHSREDLFRLFAVALRMPECWFGDEEYAPNADAFLEYIDDVVEWVPAKGHVVLVRNATKLWRNQPQLAGMLTEWWQLAVLGRDATVHLVFVW